MALGNAGRSAQSLPSSHSELSATAQVPRPAAPKAFAPEQKATDMAPSEQMPSYEDGHVFEHFIVAASFIALARSPDDRGMLSTTPRSVRISSSGVCGCGIGEASGIGDSAPYGATVAPLRPSSRSSGSTMRMLSLLSRSGIISAGGDDARRKGRWLGRRLSDQVELIQRSRMRCIRTAMCGQN